MVQKSEAKSGSNFTTFDKKTIEIYVFDKKDKKLLSDQLFVNCYVLDATVEWEEFDKLRIKLKGEKSPILISLEYRFNKNLNQFTRSDAH